jgi:hypothetical protein
MGQFMKNWREFLVRIFPYNFAGAEKQQPRIGRARPVLLPARCFGNQEI